MLSILDILKKYQEDKKKNKEETWQIQMLEKEKMQALRPPLGKEPPQAAENLSIFSVVHKGLSEDTFSRVKEFYAEILAWVKKVYKLEFVLAADFKKSFADIVEKQISSLNSAGKELLHISLCDYPPDEEALYRHVANVSIIALEIGKGLGLDKQRLIELGIAAFMHDIGIIRYLELINKKGTLSNEEYARIKDHPMQGLEVMSKIAGEFSPGIIETVSQEHERLDGTGYPKGLKAQELKEFPQIIAMVDVYEALTHARPYRSRFSPSKAMNMILNKKASFNADILKVFLERIGIFPIGTMVRLNTKEIGVVTQVNQGLPLRPIVAVLLDETGKKLSQPKQLDLGANLLICIEECCDSAGGPAP